MADTPTALAKARALIEAHGKAEVARAEFSPRPKPELHDYRDRARNDSPAIAEALVEADALIRGLTDWAINPNDDGKRFPLEELVKARDWLAKHGERG